MFCPPQITAESRACRHRKFRRRGWRMAIAVLAGWSLLSLLLFRAAPLPEPLLRPVPTRLTWVGLRGLPGDLAERVAVGSPAAFALPAPAGFSHSLRNLRMTLAPPLQTAPAPALSTPAANAADGVPFPAFPNLRAAIAPGGALSDTHFGPPVFPPRTAPVEPAQILFPVGWESRLFSGIDLNFGSWSPSPWTARVEVRFDALGIPNSVMLANGSGDAAVDLRLARSVGGWRLLDASAPRAGVIAWHSPGGAEPEALP